jgi:mono/diheme cytochrome c family protein
MQARFGLVLALGLVGFVAGSAVVGAQAPSTATSTPTFSKDVAPILFEKCASCHRPGQMGPMSLLSYQEARPYARAIRSRVEGGTMPPWHADAPPGTFLNERQLSDAERDIIVRWASGGAPEGNPKDLPPAPAFSEGWTIGTPDAVLSMREEFDVPASGEIPYQYFEIPTNFTEDRWVKAIEIKPGAKAVVHHILVYARQPDGAPAPPSYRPVPVANPAPPPAPGARVAGGVRDAEGRPRLTAPRGALIATTAPGTNAMTFQPGTGLLVKAGSILTFQVHYTANGTSYNDRSSVGFVFLKESPQREIRSSAFVNAQFALPPGAANERVEAAIEFTEDSHIWALFPHTHLRGKAWEYTLIHPDGRSEVVLSVPRYDFNWQTYYVYARPLAAPKGSRLVAVAYYDNSAANPSNPDPKVEVRWGEQTWEEMHYSGITFTVDKASRATTEGQGQP